MTRTLSLLLLIAVVPTTTAAQVLHSTAHDSALIRLHWLTGCWEMRMGNTTVEERWSAPRGGIMMETGRTLRGDSLLEYEFVVLHQVAGRTLYEAHPSAQPSNAFPLKTLSDRAIEFEDSTHDFPHRVGYRAVGLDSLEAWIAGPQEGREALYRFGYHRISCDAR